MAQTLWNERLNNQLLDVEKASTPEGVVRQLGALQAQDYASALWAIGVRMREGTLAAVEQAVLERRIVRTWPMRGTLHVVPAEDVRWMLSLTATRTISASKGRLAALAIDAALLARCEKLLVRELEAAQQLTRAEIMTLLERAQSVDGQRGYHVLVQLSMRGVLCFAAPLGKQPTFALLDSWAPRQRELDGEAALATLATRYFQSRSPATVHDFAWWSGLTLTQARAGLALARPTLLELERKRLHERAKARKGHGSAHLLPGFDEYLLGYKDRSAVLPPMYADRVVPGSNGIFLPTLVLGGKVVGTWTRALTKRSARITLAPFSPLSRAGRSALERAAEQYGRFMNLAVDVR
jgi:hypothetical protein